MSYLVHYTRLTTSDKLSDRFLTSQAYQPGEGEPMIFSQVEIRSPWFPNSQVGQTIINTLIREYYRGEDTSELINFENALKRVNEALARLAEGGETEWLGKLNATLVLVSGNQIHFAGTGQTLTYLFRRGKQSEITEPINTPATTLETESHPLRTFTNITSGSLELHDKIFLGNLGFFEHIPLEKVREIVSANPPSLATLEIAKVLKKQKIKTVNAIILELTTPEQFQNLPSDQKFETVYLNQPLETPFSALKKFQGKFLSPLFQTSYRASKKGFATLAFHGRKTILPAVKAGLGVGENYTLRGLKYLGKGLGRGGKFIQGKIQKKVKQAEERPEDQRPLAAQGLVILSNFWQKAVSFFKQFFRKIKLFLRRVFPTLEQTFNLRLKNRSTSYLITAIILLLVLIVGVGLIRASQTKKGRKEDMEATLNRLLDRKEQASLAMAYNEEDQAITLYSSIIKEAKDLSKTSEFKVAAENLIKETEKVLDELSKTKRLSEIKELGTLNGGVFAISDSKPLVVSEKEIFRLSEPRETLKSVNLSPGARDVFLDGEKKTAFVLTESEEVYRFKLEEKTFEKISPEGSDWGQAQKILEFTGNLYLFAPRQNQIWKHGTLEGDKFDKGKAYITGSDIDIKEGIDFAIDGNLYILKNNGEIIKLSKGEKVDFKLEVPDFAQIVSPLGIFTQSDLTSLYIFDAGKDEIFAQIVEFDKTGKYKGRIVLPDSLTGASKIRFLPKENLVFVEKEGKLFSVKPGKI